MYQAIALDAFGTTLDIHDRRNPYHELFRLLGNALDPQLARRLAMTTPTTFDELAAEAAGKRPDLAAQIASLRHDLAAEVNSIQLYPETIEVLQALMARKLKLSIISNLAQPYGEPIKQLLGGLIDCFVFSYEAGAIKPQAAIFRALSDTLHVPPAEILVVGNSLKNDFHGARAAGMSALYLDRNSSKPNENTIADLTGILAHI